MDVAANASVGKIIYELLQARYQAAGWEVPRIKLDSLGEVFFSGVDISTQEQDTDNLQFNLFWYVLCSMIWTAHHAPNEAAVAGVVEFFVRTLPEMHLQPLSDQEAAALTEELTALIKKQQPAATLGALGHALYYVASELLSHVPRGKQRRQKRLALLEKTKELCLQIEASTELSARKHYSSLLAEQFAQEVRFSSNSSARIIDLFERAMRIIVYPSFTKPANN